MKTAPSKKCKYCNKEFYKFPTDSSSYWKVKSFCSKRCANNFNENNRFKAGVPRPKEVIEKMRATMFKKGIPACNKGKHIDATKGEKHWNWQGGKTPEIRAIRVSLEYKIWREAVFIRDNYTCVWCGIKSAKGIKAFLHADHIQPFSDYPELRFAIDNGRTLCKDCHYKRHHPKF